MGRRLVIFTFVALLAFLAVPVFFIFLSSVPLPKPIPKLTTVILDQDDRQIGALFQENRIPVKLKQVTEYLPQAFVAAEDRRFYTHYGIDPRAVARAILENIRKGRYVEGASTITQQLARNRYDLSLKKSIDRKLREVVLALKLERHYTKDEILEMYMNEIYFGHGTYGVEAAARLYFDKHASELSLPEAALLAGLVRGPGIYSPYINPDAALKRRSTVLYEMAEQGYITDAQAREASKQELNVVPLQQRGLKAPYFIDLVIQEVEKMLPGSQSIITRAGWTIKTTLSLDMQKKAEESIARLAVQEIDNEGVRQPQIALVAIDPQSGGVRALLGGRDYKETQFNRAVTKRQPGSAFKPFVYAAAFDRNYTTVSTFVCEPVEFPIPGGEPWRPKDFGGGYHYEEMTLRRALVISDNVVSAKLHNEIGPDLAINYARRMGIKSSLGRHLSLVLGTSSVSPLEMAAAYVPFATGGIGVEPHFVETVTDQNGRELATHQTKRWVALDARTAFIITDILKGVLRPGGTAAHAGELLSRPAAGKTGSTGTRENLINAWFVGYTPDLVSSVYVGHDARKPIGRTGGSAAAPIWADFMERALAEKPPSDFTEPPGIIRREVCTTTWKLATPYCPETITEIFRSGTEPTQFCPIHGPMRPRIEPTPPDLFDNRLGEGDSEMSEPEGEDSPRDGGQDVDVD